MEIPRAGRRSGIGSSRNLRGKRTPAAAARSRGNSPGHHPSRSPGAAEGAAGYGVYLTQLKLWPHSLSRPVGACHVLSHYPGRCPGLACYGPLALRFSSFKNALICAAPFSAPVLKPRVDDLVDDPCGGAAESGTSGKAGGLKRPERLKAAQPFGLEHFKINYSQGPKARNRPAQGNALGKRDRQWQAPTGRNNRCGHSFI
jgi:hypothetical protein